MFNLSESDIHLSAQAENKAQVLEQVAAALEQAGFVEAGYLKGLQERETQTSTFLGNGIAIPHGTLDTRAMVKKTGVQVFQFPQGIEWGDGNKAHVVIGIAARSDEHLALLRQLTQVLGDEDAAAKLASVQDVVKFRAILMGEVQNFTVKAETITLEVETDSLLTLTAINAGKLESQQAVNNQFVSEVIGTAALPLGNGIWLTDSTVGNLKNALAFSRAQTEFSHNGKVVKAVLTIAAKDEQVNETLARLLDNNVQNTLLSGGVSRILDVLNGVAVGSELTKNTPFVADSVVGIFTVRNEHGLHARPSAELVNIVKSFNAKITVENLSRGSAAVSAKSLMKIVALGVVQGHRLRFVAEGDDAQVAIEAIGKAIAEGLGESVSAIPPSEADMIEVIGNTQSESKPEVDSEASDAVEATFILKNEHGLHARPSTVLVNEVKKYNAAVQVQNLDRNTPLVSAKSLMKIVALGAVKGSRLRFVATGEQAQEAIDGIGKAMEAGLGE